MQEIYDDITIAQFQKALKNAFDNLQKDAIKLKKEEPHPDE